MKLRFSPTSPYVRKVLICAIERGLDDRIERILTDTTDPKTDLPSVNPLGKVPALTLDDGTVLYDSPVICEYLDSLHESEPLIPPPGPSRWTVLRRQALADGILDAAILRMIETVRRPEALRWSKFNDLQAGKVKRAVDALEKEAVEFDGALDLGKISVACALGYLDFRFAADNWRAGHPELANWYELFAARASMQATVPVAIT